MKKTLVLLLLIPVLIASCKISYGFKGGVVADDLKTIEIRDFLNQSPLVYAPLTQTLNEKIKDIYSRNTKLQNTTTSPDVELEGEIVRYDIAPIAAQQDGFAAQTRLTMAVKIRFRNNKDSRKDKDETISAYRDFDSNKMLEDVQDQLIDELTKEIVDQIFNITMMDW